MTTGCTPRPEEAGRTLILIRDPRHPPAGSGPSRYLGFLDPYTWTPSSDAALLPDAATAVERTVGRGPLSGSRSRAGHTARHGPRPERA